VFLHKTYVGIQAAQAAAAAAALVEPRPFDTYGHSFHIINFYCPVAY
jgi:hypothetical protein